MIWNVWMLSPTGNIRYCFNGKSKTITIITKKKQIFFCNTYPMFMYLYGISLFCSKRKLQKRKTKCKCIFWKSRSYSAEQFSKQYIFLYWNDTKQTNKKIKIMTLTLPCACNISHRIIISFVFAFAVYCNKMSKDVFIRIHV